MSSEFEEDSPKEGSYSSSTYGSTSNDDTQNAQVSQENLSQSRIDKHNLNLPHTVIVTEQNKRFELMGTLSVEEAKELQSQTTLVVESKHNKVVLGQGNFGKVRLAKDEQGHYVAIKKIKNPSAGIERELEVYNALLEHQIPNVMVPEASIRSVNKKGETTLYQFMPLADFGDGDLFRVALRVADLTQRDRDLLAMQNSKAIINAFALMHENGIYHLDFKPANLLFDANGNLYISDFGSSLTKMVGYKQCTLPSVDVSYLPPEVYLSTQKTAKELLNIDSWRLGLTLLQISYPDIDLTSIRKPLAEAYGKFKNTGARPYEYEMLAKQINEEVENVRIELEKRNVPEAMQTIITGLLTVDPERRMTPQSAMNEMEKVSSLSTNAVNEMFVKLLSERQFAEFMQKVRKCNSVEQEMNRVRPNIGDKLQQQYEQLNKFKPYISILQDKQLTEEEKTDKMRNAFNQFNKQHQRVSTPSVQQKPNIP